jgi:hypothetical protein
LCRRDPVSSFPARLPGAAARLTGVIDTAATARSTFARPVPCWHQAPSRRAMAPVVTLPDLACVPSAGTGVPGRRSWASGGDRFPSRSLQWHQHVGMTQYRRSSSRP